LTCSSSCQLFEKFSTALHWILKNRLGIVGIFHLLDDFFFVGKANSQICGYTLNVFLKMCKQIGVPIKHDKTQLPTRVLTIYGIEIDSRQQLC